MCSKINFIFLNTFSDTQFSWSGEVKHGEFNTSSLNAVYFFKDSISSSYRYLTMVSIYLQGLSAVPGFNLIIWRPNCNYYCYRLNKCTSVNKCTKVRPHNSARAIKCSTTNSVFSIGLRGCYNESVPAASVNSFSNLLDFSTYKLNQEIYIDTRNSYENNNVSYFILPSKVTLNPGDVVSIYRENASFAFPPSGPGSDSVIDISKINNFDVRSDLSAQNGSGVVFYSTDLLDSGIGHYIKLYYTKEIAYSYEYSYQTFICDPASPLCKATVDYDLIVSVQDSFNQTKTVDTSVQLDVALENALDFTFEPLSKQLLLTSSYY